MRGAQLITPVQLQVSGGEDVWGGGGRRMCEFFLCLLLCNTFLPVLYCSYVLVCRLLW